MNSTNTTEISKLGSMPISKSEFNDLTKLIYEQTGIYLTEAKKSLVVSRLQKICRAMGFTDFRQYYDFVIQNPDGKALTELINKISTNHTFFYRESSHFEYFSKTALPQCIKRRKAMGKKVFRIWCAAASSGEEPYTLAMLIKEYLGMDYSQWDVGLLATDISRDILDKATQGVYEERGARELPDKLYKKYFKELKNGMVEVKPELKKEVTYRCFNLMNPLPFKSNFDVVFIRNVMIYFDEPTKIKLVSKIIQKLNPGGYLFIGHAESLNGITKELEYVLPACYRKPG